MGAQQSATVQVTNNSGGTAWVALFHSNSSTGTQSGNWTAAPGETVGPLTVFYTDSLFNLDYWSVMIFVQDGPAPGLYVSGGSLLEPNWVECRLDSDDAGQTLTFSASTTQLDVNRASGGTCTAALTLLAPCAATSPPCAQVSHVFVVMLENHSFDNVFAMSQIEGITAATTSDSNTYDNETYYVQSGAPLTMPTDPGHEFPDTVEQLAGEGVTYPPGGPYPAIDNSGFVANYATTTTEGPLPPADDIGKVMACFATPTQLPVILQLATEFAICDQWHSSIPGPTWPNRFFVHGASSSGLDSSPSTGEIAGWELPGGGFQYPNGSIYDALKAAGIPYRFYQDTTGFPLERSLYSDDPQNGSPAGAVAQVTSLSGVTLLDIHSLKNFAADLQGPYPWPYTFIEPHYGDLLSGTYAGGSSQHPMDDVYGGEHLLASVYAAIRNSPYWNTSLLIITYDEHGGFYDSVAPGAAPAPGDNPDYGYNQFGFNFELFGIRVPAVVVSPLIPAGTVDHTLYDHSSVLATLEQMWGLPALTQRDAAANDVLPLLSLTTPRPDCPTSLTSPPPPLMAAKPRMSVEERARRDALPVPQHGNLVGALQILRKTEIELSAGTPPELAAIHARHEAIQTRGDARAYVASVMEKVGIAREQRQLAARRAP